MVAADRPDLLSVKDAARFFQVHPSTIRRWVHLKKLPALQVGGGPIRVIPPQLESLASACPAYGNSRGVR